MFYELLAAVGGRKPRGEGPLDWRGTRNDSGRSGKCCLCHTANVLKSWHLCVENILLAKGPTCQDHRLEGKYFEVRSSSPWKTRFCHIYIISPGFLDIQINGAYGFDFSVYENDDESYRRGLQMVAERIVETGVTSYVLTWCCWSGTAHIIHYLYVLG